MPQFLLSVIHPYHRADMPEEFPPEMAEVFAAVDAYNERLQTDGHWVFAGGLTPIDDARVARTALELIHYDPDTGTDLGKAPGARERCEKGCYDCLLSYSNQYEHRSIDRHTIVPLLRQLMTAVVTSGAGGRDRPAQQAWLDALSDSGLERRFINWLNEHGYRLPDDAQRSVSLADARPDFIYDIPGNPVAVFVDGPHHDDAHQHERDGRAADRLENLGWTVVRVHHAEDWATVISRHRWIFGPGRNPG